MKEALVRDAEDFAGGRLVVEPSAVLGRKQNRRTDNPRRILVNDHAGHAFPVQLSRQLAALGHQVVHSYCGCVETPRGRLARGDDDPGNFHIERLDLPRAFHRYGLFSRVKQELELGRQLARVVRRFEPHTVISGNCPLFTQAALMRASRKQGAKFVFWVQDLLGVGIQQALRKRIPVVGSLIGYLLVGLERWLLRRSQTVILITEDFKKFMPRSVLARGDVNVIENWAPLDEIPMLPKDNEWSRRHGLADKRCAVYSGTLGLKHNPEMLVGLAEALRVHDDARLVVITQGLGAEYLIRAKQEKQLDNLVLMDFQPFEDLPRVLATADVLLGILEREGGEFCVPSKVLSYLCAGRPIVLACPEQNLAARIIDNSGAGVVVRPDDPERFAHEASGLLQDEERCRQFAERGVAYAREHFEIERIGEIFDGLLSIRESGIGTERRR